MKTCLKHWVNTCEYYHNTYEYCHNTCNYWAGEYTLSTCWFQHFIKNKKAWSETLKNPSSQLFPPFLYGLFPHRNRGTLKTWFLFTLLNHTITWRRSWLCSILSRQVISKWLRYCFKLSKHFGNFSLSISGIYFIGLQSFTFWESTSQKRWCRSFISKGSHISYKQHLAVGEKSGFGNFGYNFILPEVTTLP